jgi:hypothetical protein
MIRRIVTSLILLGLLTTSAAADPSLTIVPLGLQSGNWVWRVDITPDLSIVPAAADGSPLALVIGFRLTGSPLATATNINPSVFDNAIPGKIIFGWETKDPTANNNPVGLQSNLQTGEAFSAFGTIDFKTGVHGRFLKSSHSGQVTEVDLQALSSGSALSLEKE